MSAHISRMDPSDLDSFIIPSIVTVLLLLFTYVLLKFVLGRPKGDTIVLMGLEGAGKTVLYAQLVAGKEVQSQTSLQANKAALPGTSFVLVDVPGNTRVRAEAFTLAAKSVRGVVLVLDSGTFVDNVRECSEVLYEVLLNSDVKASRCPIVLMCNKQDEELARGCAPIQAAVERELTTINNTSAASLSDDSGTTRTLAPANTTVSFASLPNPITAIAGTCTGSEVQLTEINQWINAL